MEVNPDQQELIDRFLQGKLEGIVLADFLKAVKMNPALEKELQMQQAMAEGIEFHGNDKLRKRFRKISQEVKSEAISNKPKKGRLIRLALFAAASVAVLLICVNLFFQKPSINTAYTQFYTPSTLTISRNGNIDNQFAQAESLYNNKKYNDAIPLLQTISANQPQNSNIQLALGNAFLNVKKYNDAILQFQTILDRKDLLYSDQAKWFLALTHLKTKDTKEARRLLQELANDPNADYHTQAIEILRLL